MKLNVDLTSQAHGLVKYIDAGCLKAQLKVILNAKESLEQVLIVMWRIIWTFVGYLSYR
jgi:hypothetical protein